MLQLKACGDRLANPPSALEVPSSSNETKLNGVSAAAMPRNLKER